jgi:hypothetical protein
MKQIDELRRLLHRKGISMSDFIKLVLTVGFLTGFVGILLYGAVGALIS